MGFSQSTKAVKTMQKYCKSAEMFVSWRCSVCVVLEQCSCQTGLPSESNANIRFFSGKSKQNWIFFLIQLNHFLSLSCFNIFSRAEYSLSLTSSMKSSGNPSQTGFMLHSKLAKMAFNLAQVSSQPLARRSQMLNTSRAVFVFFI